MGEEEVTVAVTPNGYADAIYDGQFVMPEERTMTMNAFLDVIESPNEYNGVFYVQKQNSNLTDELNNWLMTSSRIFHGQQKHSVSVP